ncbi:hypothetical protein NLU13_4282 [Sarocladium strictum]|uniref:Uncharacterized protein n=1 Tax=Sarocladium strictum TaxID=5046 RepID=A0AA39L8I0_SARSR|nr:hypothetical protein NLU13_4282 [Sarocladium strictum]
MAAAGPPIISGTAASAGATSGTTTKMQASVQASMTPATRHSRSRKRVRRPVQGSLYDVMHEHAGTSLFLRPICWTDTHAELLGARFEGLPPCDTPVPSSIPGSPPSKGHMRPSPTITALSNALTEILAPNQFQSIVTFGAVRTVLQILWPNTFSKPRFMPEWHLHFGERVYRDAVRAPVMWSFPMQHAHSSTASFQTTSTQSVTSSDPLGDLVAGVHNPAGLPMLCYIGRSHLAAIRRNLFRIARGPSQVPNEPVLRLQNLRAKKLIPSNPDHDAHFVGIFLAMAQRHFYGPCITSRQESQAKLLASRRNRPHFQDIKLRILTHDSDTADFIVYTAYVTAHFLQRFHDPASRPDGATSESEGMKIEFTRVPIWPILGLRERLGKALGRDLVGIIDEDKIETWQPIEEEAPKSPTRGKRKRDALAEVVNSSFEDECDTEPSLGGKKQCLREGSQIGVVI